MNTQPCLEARKILDEMQEKYGPLKMAAFSSAIGNLVNFLGVDDECVAQYGVAMRHQLDFLKEKEELTRVE